MGLRIKIAIGIIGLTAITRGSLLVVRMHQPWGGFVVAFGIALWVAVEWSRNPARFSEDV